MRHLPATIGILLVLITGALAFDPPGEAPMLVRADGFIPHADSVEILARVSTPVIPTTQRCSSAIKIS